MFIHQELIDEVRDKDVILFVGAGLTMNLGLPSWNTLIDVMASDLGLDPDKFKKSGDFYELAEYYKLKKGSIGPIRSWMDVNFHSNKLEIGESTIFKTLVELDFPVIYTTNYDRWVEIAYDYYKKPYTKICNIFDLTKITQGVTQLIKFHGDFDDDETIVLSESSYFERLALDSPLDMKLRTDTMGKTILFIGYSLSDINIRYLFYKLNQYWSASGFEGVKPKSYIFMVEDNPVKRLLLREKGIEAIVPEIEDDQKALEDFLIQLKNQSQKSTKKV
jgi:hypothetical protein